MYNYIELLVYRKCNTNTYILTKKLLIVGSIKFIGFKFYEFLSKRNIQHIGLIIMTYNMI